MQENEGCDVICGVSACLASHGPRISMQKKGRGKRHIDGTQEEILEDGF